MSSANTRMEAFSDGVFAVAITLLALDLTVDGPGHGTLAHQLGHKWPAFAAYVISFFSIGIMWVNHHALVRGFREDREQRAMLYLNLVLLLFVVAIPFGTATVSQYVTKDDADGHLAAAIYSSLFLAAGLSFAVLFTWAIRSGTLRQTLTGAEARRAVLRFGFGNLGYLVAVIVAFVSPPASLAINAAMAVYYVAERTPSSGAA